GNRERDTDTNHADDPSKAVGEGDTHVVPEKNRPQARGEMADDEKRGEGIMGNESNVQRIMQKTRGGSGSQGESRVNVEEHPSEDENGNKARGNNHHQKGPGTGLEG